jgi:hypothetical protein
MSDPATYQKFANLPDATAYVAQQTALMNLPVGGVTTQWAEPILLADGSYVVQAYQDANAVPWDAAWTLPAQPDD